MTHVAINKHRTFQGRPTRLGLACLRSCIQYHNECAPPDYIDSISNSLSERVCSPSELSAERATRVGECCLIKKANLMKAPATLILKSERPALHYAFSDFTAFFPFLIRADDLGYTAVEAMVKRI
jgi:hypothetical protein